MTEMTIEQVQELRADIFSAAPGAPTLQALVRLQGSAFQVAELALTLHAELQQEREGREKLAEALVWVVVRPDGTVPAASLYRGQSEKVFRAECGGFILPAKLVSGPVTLGGQLGEKPTPDPADIEKSGPEVYTSAQQAKDFTYVSAPAETLRAENDRLRAALGFYSSRVSWQRKQGDWDMTSGPLPRVVRQESDTELDGGQRARAALTQTKATP